MSSPTPQCLKRLQIELRQLSKEKDTSYQIGADPQNMLRCYFVMDGPADTPYAGGRYVGLLEIPSDYPFKPPSVQMCTPSGRFKTGMAICLSNSSYHPEQWSPMWGLRTILIALVSFFVSNESTTGSMESSEADRRKYASDSRRYNVERISTVYKRVLPEAYAADVAFLENLSKPLSAVETVPHRTDSDTQSDDDDEENNSGRGDPTKKQARKEHGGTTSNTAKGGKGNGKSASSSKHKSSGTAGKQSAAAGGAAAGMDDDESEMTGELPAPVEGADDAVAEGEDKEEGASEAGAQGRPRRTHRRHKPTGESPSTSSTVKEAAQKVAEQNVVPWRRWISMAVVVAVGMVLMEQLRWCLGQH